MNNISDSNISDMVEELAIRAQEGPEPLLHAVVTRFTDCVKLASSLGAEDQVLTHMILNIDPKARIFVLDTGRLHQETYDLMARTMSRYRMQYEVFAPGQKSLQKMVSLGGPNLFYNSVKERKHCCWVRKVEPLGRALAEASAWVTGLRREQSVERAETPLVEWDANHELIKINPLAEWKDSHVWDYLLTNKVPYNVLHKQGFKSIGCAPCTRGIETGEDARAGRWWWEHGAAKECGLHVTEVGE